MKIIDKNQAGMTLGIYFGAMHLLWSVSVALGLAEGIANFTMQMHFVDRQYQINSFNLLTAVIGLGLACISGYVMGWAFGWLWNRVGNK